MEEFNWGPQALNVISSNARSFPQPPGELLTIRTTTSVTPAAVVKKKPTCCQAGLGCVGILPVLNDCNRLPSVFSMLNVRLGCVPFDPQAVGRRILIIHAANSYVVLPHSPRTVSR